MYNNALIQTTYKPYIPPPRKNAVNNGEKKEPETKGQVIVPNNYASYNNQEKSGSDTFTKSEFQAPAKININQVLIDFNSTLNAIGASEDVEEEVKTYLGLVETQSQKENPNKKMIVSNLKIAADVLDTYISDTLKKPSKVVKDWVEALLLQNIDFKADNNITKGAFEAITGEQPQTAKLAEKKLAQKQQENNVENLLEAQLAEPEVKEDAEKTEETSQHKEQIEYLISKSDDISKSLPKEALMCLSDAFTIAQNSADKGSMAIIYSKIAKIQNDLNNLPQALDCLNASTIIAYSLGNNELKTQNHKQMGSIYDVAGYMDTALGHYYASIGIDGILEDTNNQADTLNKIGNMYSHKYEKNNAIENYKDALELAKVEKNFDIMADSFVGSALTFKNNGDNSKAISNFKNAAILSKKAGNDKNLANIYEQAGDLMNNKNHQKRALDLYKKSYRLAEKLQNNEALVRLREKLSLSFA